MNIKMVYGGTDTRPKEVQEREQQMRAAEFITLKAAEDDAVSDTLRSIEYIAKTSGGQELILGSWRKLAFQDLKMLLQAAIDSAMPNTAELLRKEINSRRVSQEADQILKDILAENLDQTDAVDEWIHALQTSPDAVEMVLGEMEKYAATPEGRKILTLEAEETEVAVLSATLEALGNGEQYPNLTKLMRRIVDERHEANAYLETLGFESDAALDTWAEEQFHTNMAEGLDADTAAWKLVAQVEARSLDKALQNPEVKAELLDELRTLPMSVLGRYDELAKLPSLSKDVREFIGIAQLWRRVRSSDRNRFFGHGCKPSMLLSTDLQYLAASLNRLIVDPIGRMVIWRQIKSMPISEVVWLHQYGSTFDLSVFCIDFLEKSIEFRKSTEPKTAGAALMDALLGCKRCEYLRTLSPDDTFYRVLPNCTCKKMIPFEPSTAIPAKQWAAPELKPANHTSKWPHHQSKNPVPFVEWGKVAAVAPEGSCTVSLKNRNWEDEVEPDIIIGANYELYIK